MKLDYLISLKQQQVTVVQAWQSMRQGEDNQKQNLTLLVFTVVTVVFVSLIWLHKRLSIFNVGIDMTASFRCLSYQVSLA